MLSQQEFENLHTLIFVKLGYVGIVGCQECDDVFCLLCGTEFSALITNGDPELSMTGRLKKCM